MFCTCGSRTIVKDSRVQEVGYWRRRRCLACGNTFTTFEQVCETLPQKRAKVLAEKPAPVARRPSRVPAAVRIAAPVEKITSARARMEDIRISKEYDDE